MAYALDQLSGKHLYLGTAYFRANQAVANLDFIATAKDTLALKYYYQHDPSVAPYAYSGVSGFTQKLDAGSQVASITNTQTLTPNFNVAESIGFLREKVYSTIGQPFTPQQFAPTWRVSPGIRSRLDDQHVRLDLFPGLTISDNFGNPQASVPEPFYNTNLVFNASLSVGDGANSQGRLQVSSRIAGCLQQMPSGSRETHGHPRRQFFLYAAEHQRRPNEQRNHIL